MPRSRPAPMIVGNWKMHGVTADLAEIGAIARELLERPTPMEVVICPPATLLAIASRMLDATGIATGGQDCSADDDTPHTGGVSAAMLADAGAQHVLVGHSERRRLDGETDSQVAAKAAAAGRAKLRPIICVGETAAQRAAGRAPAVVRRQVRRSCPAELGGGTFAVAYEPGWAIGASATPTSTEIEAAHAAIREALFQCFGDAGLSTRVLYGGAVDRTNAAQLLRTPGVDGLLVGRAALRAAQFLPVVRAACQTTAPPLEYLPTD